MKSIEQDPDKKWITTWNHYLNRIKLFVRWLYNYYLIKEQNLEANEEWVTPDFCKIKPKQTKRISPYLESEIWEREELLALIKYEPIVRNKAVLSLMWDLNARSHEITLLRIKNLRLKDRYGEEEIPHEAKTGTGPILLMMSFPYVRDWLNLHPFKNERNARLICNLHNGSPIKPKTIWNIMNQLHKRVIRLLQSRFRIFRTVSD
jgi:site-specific recombinase XerC